MTHRRKVHKILKGIRQQIADKNNIKLIIVGILLGMLGGFTNGFAQQQADTLNAEFLKITNDTIPQVIEDEVMPEYPGGWNELYRFLTSNIRYPEKAKKKGKTGTVIVGFVIEIDGSVGEVKAVKNVHPELDREAVRIVKMMPNWIPGKQMGKPVRTFYQIPIKFTITGTDKKKKSRF